MALAIVLLGPPAAPAGSARIAVASNFRDAALEIGAAFRVASGHEVAFSFGSTGQLFAQIAHGAPFDALLAADRERAARIVGQGLGVAGSSFTYAEGRIVLFSADDGLDVGPEALKEGDFERLAIADPASAPYGKAAVQVLQALDRFEALQALIVRGLNVAQAYQFVQTGNAELGFVALSQVVGHSAGSRWIVPVSMHSPIAQDAVLLEQGATNEAAKAFLAFLRGARAKSIVAEFGYGSEN